MQNICFWEKYEQIHCEKFFCKCMQCVSNVKNALDVLQIPQVKDGPIKELKQFWIDPLPSTKMAALMLQAKNFLPCA